MEKLFSIGELKKAVAGAHKTAGFYDDKYWDTVAKLDAAEAAKFEEEHPEVAVEVRYVNDLGKEYFSRKQALRNGTVKIPTTLLNDL